MNVQRGQTSKLPICSTTCIPRSTCSKCRLCCRPGASADFRAARGTEADKDVKLPKKDEIWHLESGRIHKPTSGGSLKICPCLQVSFTSYGTAVCSRDEVRLQHIKMRVPGLLSKRRW